MSTKSSVALTDPEIRKTTPEELAEITGWNKDLIRRAARAGVLVEMGVIFVPSDVNPREGTYMCALKPFLRWFRGDVATERQTTAQAAREVNFVHKVSTLRTLLDESVAS